jgi:hypothetical protein
LTKKADEYSEGSRCSKIKVKISGMPRTECMGDEEKEKEGRTDKEGGCGMRRKGAVQFGRMVLELNNRKSGK